MIELYVRTGRREELIDVTERVQDAVQRSGITAGLCHVFSPHTTCAVTINEGYDPAVAADVVRHLGDAVPRAGEWEHAEGNSDAHMKAILVGAGVTVPVAEGRLRLGRWQAVFFCEFDGPRERTLWVTIT